jgi:hypothetical protein
MSIREQGATLSKPIKIRRLHLRMPAQAANPVIQVINSDEQDVGFFLSIGEVPRYQQDQCEEAEGGKCSFHSDPWLKRLFPFATGPKHI